MLLLYSYLFYYCYSVATAVAKLAWSLLDIWYLLIFCDFWICSNIPSSRVQDQFLDSIMDSISMDPSLDGSYILTITNSVAVMFILQVCEEEEDQDR